MHSQPQSTRLRENKGLHSQSQSTRLREHTSEHPQPRNTSFRGDARLVKKMNLDLRLRWQDRALAFRMCTTKKHQSQQERMLSLFGPLSEEERHTAITNNTNWKSSTKDSYWATYISAAKIAQVPVTVGDLAMMRHLHQNAQLQEDVTQIVPMTVQQFLSIMTSSTSIETKVAIAIGFTLGQRISDVLNLRAADVLFMDNAICIIFRIGKVTKHIGPYSLFLALDTLLATYLSRLKKKCLNQPLLFSTETHCAVKNAVHAMNLDMRSIRKGGLWRMAAEGRTVPEILDYSKHRTQHMLYRYLGAGQALVHLQEKMTAQQSTITHMTDTSLLSTLRPLYLYSQPTNHQPAAHFRYSQKVYRVVVSPNFAN